jgi:hypothetical protein
MLWELFASLACPLVAGCAGYNLNGTFSGAIAGFLAYSVLNMYMGVVLRYQRRDYWASKLAMLKAEAAALSLALAKDGREQATGTLPESNQAIPDAYRARLALLQVSMAAVRAGYASEKKAGLFGHGSARRAGLVDAAS